MQIDDNFLRDLDKLTPSAVVLYLFMKKKADDKIKSLKDDKDYHFIDIELSYQDMGKFTKLSKASIRKSILLLSEHGWINGYKRGGKKTGKSLYRIPMKRKYNEKAHFDMLLWRNNNEQD